MARFYGDVDENGMPTEDLPEIRPQLGIGEDPSGTAMNPPEDVTPFLSERDKALDALTRFRQKRPSLWARLANAGGIAVPQSRIGFKGRSARLVLRGLLTGVNTAGRMKANDQTRDMANLMQTLKERQGMVNDVEGRNKDQAALQKDINAELRAQRTQDRLEKALEARLQNDKEKDDSGYDAARTDAMKALAEQRRSRLGFNPRTGGRGGAGGAGGKPPTYSQERTQINALASSELARRTGAMVTRGQGAGWTKSQIEAGLGRMRAQVEMEHTQMLNDLDEKWGVTREKINPAQLEVDDPNSVAGIKARMKAAKGK